MKAGVACRHFCFARKAAVLLLSRESRSLGETARSVPERRAAVASGGSSCWAVASARGAFVELAGGALQASPARHDRTGLEQPVQVGGSATSGDLVPASSVIAALFEAGLTTT